MKSTIQFTWTLVTPQTAKEWLLLNRVNRKWSRGQVNKIAASIKRGKWRETHQPVAFNADGDLVDGQHRLTAISESGVPVYVWVATYKTKESALDLPIDEVKPRCHADLLRVSTNVTALCRESMNVVLNSRFIQPCLDDMVEIVKWLGPWIERLTDTCGAKAGAGRTSAPIRLGVIARAMQGDEKAVFAQYRALCLTDVDSMWKSTGCLLRQLLAGPNAKQNGSAINEDRLARTWRAMDQSRSNGNFVIQDAKLLCREVAECLIAHGFPEVCLGRKAER